MEAMTGDKTPLTRFSSQVGSMGSRIHCLLGMELSSDMTSLAVTGRNSSSRSATMRLMITGGVAEIVELLIVSIF